MNLYYALWADVINYERIRNGGSSHWKSFTFSYMTIMLSFNIVALFSAILFFTGYNIASATRQYLAIFSSETATNALWAIIILLLPSMCINYFLVFYRKRYEYILRNYEFKNGKFLLIYFSLSVVAFFGFSLLNR